MKKKVAVLLAACAALVFAAGCTNANESAKTKYYYFYGKMNADAALYVSAHFDNETADKLSELAQKTNDTLNAIDKSLSVTVSTSSISKFNKAAAGVEVEIDKTAYDVLTISQEMYSLTDGYYNPAVYYSVQEYAFDGSYNYPKTDEQLPSDERIEAFTTLSESFGDIQLRQGGDKYYALKPAQTVEIGGVEYSLKIDLGGIGKGYAVDAVNALIAESGFEYGYFSFAQSSIAFKKYFKNDHNYTLQLTNPRNRAQTYIDVPVQDVSVSTSGDYEQYYEIGGKRYCHVINPFTGKPVQTGVICATVIGASAAEADALSTAIMAMGKDKASEFIRQKLSDYRVIFTCDKSSDGGAYGVYTNMPATEYKITAKNFTAAEVESVA